MEIAGLLRRTLHLAAVLVTAQRTAAILASFLIASCSGSRPVEITRPSAKSFPELEQEVSKIRGLGFKRPVTFNQRPAEPGTNGTAEYGAEATTPLGRVYKRVGLLPESVDFSKALLEFERLQRMIDYDASHAVVLVTPEAVRLGQALAGDQARGAAPMIPAVLALAQALQEQHFRWQGKLRSVPLEDRKLAFGAVACGDAVLVGLKYLSNERRADDFTDQLHAIGRLGGELERMGSSLPAMLREKLVFPYREGGRFVQWAYAARGWNGVNTLFSDPPYSSAQILHPEKYYVKRTQPVRILPFGLFQKMTASPVVDQTLGESLIAVLLEASRSRTVAAQIASGWEGDHLSAYQDGDNLVTAWITAWTDGGAARMFRGAYRTALERRHRLHFEPSAGEQDGIKADLRDRRSMVLQVRGRFVLLLDGVASTRVSELSESAWKDLETSTESTVIPFDLAAGAVQFTNR